jgi:hypothetical protein
MREAAKKRFDYFIRLRKLLLRMFKRYSFSILAILLNKVTKTR